MISSVQPPMALTLLAADSLDLDAAHVAGAQKICTAMACSFARKSVHSS